MKRALLVVCALFLAFVMTFFCIPMKAPGSTQAMTLNNLTVEVSPSVLTAGVIPEKIDAKQPLTLKVTDDRGLPVDFTKMGVSGDATPKNIWANCFLDPHKDNKEFYGSFGGKLPQYYWTRTDLHNEDYTAFNNKQFGRQLSNFDMSESAKGIYKFFGFCANDAGDMRIVVRSLDGSWQGFADIKVELPKVEYEIANIENPTDFFSVPGKPDFVMTAFNQNVYKVTVIVKTADGKPIKGDTTDGLSAQTTDDMARITPFCTMPHNYTWVEKPATAEKDNIFGPGSVSYLTDIGGRNDLQMWFDTDGNGEIEDSEKKEFGPQSVHDPKSGKELGNPTYCITSNTMSEKGYGIAPQFDFPGKDSAGWGLGSIYNHPRRGGMVFADINGDKKIDLKDSIKLNGSGKASFYVTADDVCEIGVLVACNNYGDLDVTGCPPKAENSPAKPETRFFGDGTYFLDFDAVSDSTIKILPPNVKVFDAESNMELAKDLMNDEYYDCTFGMTNKLQIQLSPAHHLEKTKMKTGIYVKIEDFARVGATEESVTLRLPDEALTVYANIKYFPTNQTSKAAYLVLHRPKNNGEEKTSPIQMKELIFFDVGKGMSLKIEGAADLKQGKQSQVKIGCFEIGTGNPVKDATITLSGCGVSKAISTDLTGNAVFNILPTKSGNIEVSCTAKGYCNKYAKLNVEEKAREIAIEMTIGQKVAFYNGQPISLDVAPYIKNGTTLVPLRVITEIFEAELVWDAKEKKIAITNDGKLIVCWIGKKQAFVDGKEITLNAAPEIKEGKTTVPLRFFSEAFGCSVIWDASIKTIRIYRY